VNACAKEKGRKLKQARFLGIIDKSARPGALIYSETLMADAACDQLLPALAAGDAEAFDALYERLGARLYRAALGMLNCREDAEDAVQETFVALVRSRKRLTAINDIEAYVFASLRRAAGRCAAKRPRGQFTSETLIQEAAAPPERNEHAGLGEDLRRAVGALSAEQREVIALKIDGQLTFAQIGAATGASVNTAASRYRYALKKLRELLGNGYCRSAADALPGSRLER
jgi:RNA polymerase sigma-70 factor, ECF subfamily